MRFLLFSACFLGLNLGAHAQLSMSLAKPEEAEGRYTLLDAPQVRHAGRLRVSAHELVAKDNQGQKTTWQPDEVASLQVGAQRYTTAQGFTIHNGLWNHVEDKKVFVELLDSGRVSLLRYTSRVRSGQLGTSAEFTAYLVREGQAAPASTLYIDAGNYGYKATYPELDEALRTYAADRPNLLKALEGNRVGPTQLTRFFHALNTKTDF
jgi:hypothetical protein